MAAYLKVEAFKLLSVMPSSDVDALEKSAPGWLDAQLVYWSGWIDSRLRKRYATPFAAPVPEVVKGWLAHIVTLQAYLRRGVRAQDEQVATIQEQSATARTEISEAANAVDGLFDLPLRQNTTESGISKGAPLGYTEASPYVGLDEQARAGHEEDRNGSGTHG